MLWLKEHPCKIQSCKRSSKKSCVSTGTGIQIVRFWYHQKQQRFFSEKFLFVMKTVYYALWCKQSLPRHNTGTRIEKKLIRGSKRCRIPVAILAVVAIFKGGNEQSPPTSSVWLFFLNGGGIQFIPVPYAPLKRRRQAELPVPIPALETAATFSSYLWTSEKAATSWAPSSHYRYRNGGFTELLSVRY